MYSWAQIAFSKCSKSISCYWKIRFTDVIKHFSTMYFWFHIVHSVLVSNLYLLTSEKMWHFEHSTHSLCPWLDLLHNSLGFQCILLYGNFVSTILRLKWFSKYSVSLCFPVHNLISSSIIVENAFWWCRKIFSDAIHSYLTHIHQSARLPSKTDVMPFLGKVKRDYAFRMANSSSIYMLYCCWSGRQVKKLATLLYLNDGSPFIDVEISLWP